jgi:hypothetical protein
MQAIFGNPKFDRIHPAGRCSFAQSRRCIGKPDGIISVVVPVSVRPVPVAPVGSPVIRIAVRTIVITGRVIRWPVKDRKRDRYRQTDEDPRLSFGLSQQRKGNHCRSKNSFLHIVTNCRRKTRIHGYATTAGRASLLMLCRYFAVALARRKITGNAISQGWSEDSVPNACRKRSKMS